MVKTGGLEAPSLWRGGDDSNRAKTVLPQWLLVRTPNSCMRCLLVSLILFDTDIYNRFANQTFTDGK